MSATHHLAGAATTDAAAPTIGGGSVPGSPRPGSGDHRSHTGQSEPAQEPSDTAALLVTSSTDHTPDFSCTHTHTHEAASAFLLLLGLSYLCKKNKYRGALGKGCGPSRRWPSLPGGTPVARSGCTPERFCLTFRQTRVNVQRERESEQPPPVRSSEYSST